MKTKNVSVDQIKMYLDPIIFARSLFGFTEDCGTCNQLIPSATNRKALMFSVHRSIGGKTVYPGHQKQYNQSALHLMKTIPGCAILTMVFKQNRLLPSEGVSLTTSEQVAGFKSHASDPNCEDGEHRMKNGEMSMPTLERVTKAGIASADTIKDELHGVHWKKQGKGAGVDLTMPMSGHGSLGAAESNHADDRGISGLHFSKRKKCDTMSCSDRGKKAWQKAKPCVDT